MHQTFTTFPQGRVAPPGDSKEALSHSYLLAEVKTFWMVLRIWEIEDETLNTVLETLNIVLETLNIILETLNIILDILNIVFETLNIVLERK